METRANYVIVGIFTIAAILAAFGFVYWTAVVDNRGETATLRVRIPGSASGLGRGSAVLFNGVKVGDITRVFIDRNNPTDAIADAQIDISTPITQSTQADIGLAGLTGQANIELKGGNLAEPNLLQAALEAGEIAQITANPSAVTNLLQTAQQIFRRADSVLVELEGFARDSRGPLTDTVQNVQVFSESLARNAAGIDTFLASVSRLSTTLDGASQKLDGTLTAAEGLLNSINRQEVQQIVENITAFTSTLRTSTEQLDEIVGGVDSAVESVSSLAQGATGTVDRINRVLDGVEPEVIRNTLSNIEQAGVTANRAINDFATVADRIGNRAGDIDQAIADAQQLTQRLNQASVRVDGILLKVDNLLGSGEATGLIADASATLSSFKQVADQLNSRIGTITDGLARFTDQGLRNFEGLISDGRRAIGRIESSVSDLTRNPQRVITGGDGAVREYDGRARR
ncbi:MCE family protein [Tianweitania sediminis]|uniref:MCE family protein n=1 Tax=Tianweitania sediminis TaxID=1502156 RepID=A0A8J7UJ86_9HYPH|nr:MlaD family protein [Tianweitania sediminis]MBP0439758.1 MCE family protein [Tianweitania sediminis]